VNPTDRTGRGKEPGVNAVENDVETDAQPSDAVENLAEIYRAHADFVYRSTRYLGIPDNDADDVVHEVFVVVHRRLADYDGRAGMRAWLYGITRNLVLHHFRSLAREAHRLAAIPEPIEAPRRPDEELDLAHAVALLERFLAQLDADKRAVFAMAVIEGLTAPEIAASEGVKLNTVYSRLRVARERFAAWLAVHHDAVRENEA